MKTKPRCKKKDADWGEEVWHKTTQFPFPLGKEVTTLCGKRMETRLADTKMPKCVVCKEMAGE